MIREESGILDRLKIRKATKEFYEMINLLGSKTGNHDDSVKLHKAFELVDKRYKQWLIIIDD